MKVVSKVSFFPSNPVEGGYYYNTVASTLGIYKNGNWSFNYPLVESGKKEGDLAFDINGYYPLYFTEDEAKDASSSYSAHSHEIDGVTYYMPDGGTEGKDFFHGTFGNTYYWYQKQGPLPSWITPPPQGATVTQALEQLVNPNTGETYTVPTGGYTLNVANPSPVVPSTYSITFSHDGNSDSTTPNPSTIICDDGTVIMLSSSIGSFRNPKSGYQFDKWILWRGSPFNAAMPEWSTTANYSIGDRVYFKPSTSSISTVYICIQDHTPHWTPGDVNFTNGVNSLAYWQAAGALDNADSLTDAKFTVNGADAELRATFTAVAQPVSPPASTSTYTINVGGSLSSGYVIAGVDANGNLNGSSSNTPININVGDTIILNNQINNNHPLEIRVSNGGNPVSNPSASGQGTAQVTWTPTAPGTYVYQCINHSSMVGNIIVS